MSARAHRTTTRTRDSGGKFASTIPQGLRACSRCRSRHTSQWRTGTDGSSLCNACGIKLKRENDKLKKINARSNTKERPSKSVKTMGVQNLLNPLPANNQEIDQYQHFYQYYSHHNQ